MLAELYKYAIISGVVTQLALAFILFHTKAQQEGHSSSYKVASIMMAAVFALIALDQILSLIVIDYSDFGLYRVSTVVDVLCYTPIAMFFNAVAQILLRSGYDYVAGFKRDIIIWLCTFAAVCPTLFITNNLISNLIYTFVVAVWGTFIVTIGVRVYRAYNEASRRIEKFYSDDKNRYIRWLRNGLMSFVVWGCFSPVATISPIEFNTIYVAIGIVVQVYLASSFINYYVGFESVEVTKQLSANFFPSHHNAPTADDFAAMTLIKEWEENGGYHNRGISINDMAEQIGLTVERASSALLQMEGRSFKDYINHLRISEVQDRLIANHSISIAEVALEVGFSSEEELVEHFTAITNTSPAEWQKDVGLLMS